jgi:hypothetical protein
VLNQGVDRGHISTEREEIQRGIRSSAKILWVPLRATILRREGYGRATGEAVVHLPNPLGDAITEKTHQSVGLFSYFIMAFNSNPRSERLASKALVSRALATLGVGTDGAMCFI